MAGTAEIGRATTVPIEKLQVGMKVRGDIVGRGDKVLVSAGEVLTRKHIVQLQKWEKRPKPMGPALPRRNPKDRLERVQHGEFEGGWRPSHFNPRGVDVIATTATGDENPAVEKDVTLSPLFKGAARKSFSTGEVAVESPVFRRMALNEEIKSLEITNAQLGGDLHALKDEDRDLTEEGLSAHKEKLMSQNKELIEGLKAAKVNDDTPTFTRSKGKKRAS